MLRAREWETAAEVSFSLAGERDSIDVLARHPGISVALVVEVKSVVPDLQSMLHGLDRKARLGAVIAARHGWPAVEVAGLLVLADTRTNRRRLDDHQATIEAALPLSGRAVSAWLRAPSSAAIAGRLFLPAAHRAGRTAGGRQRVRVIAALPRTAPSIHAGAR